MKETLQDDVAANRDLPDDANLTDEAKKFVKMERNKVYNPVVSTGEVAEEFGVSKEEARDALEESPYMDSKEVGDTHVWW